MNEERIKEVFSDEAFVKELLSKETPEEVQAMLEDKDIEMSVSEIVKLREMIIKKIENPDVELSEDELEDVSGGVLPLMIAAAAAPLVLLGVMAGITFGADAVDKKTGGRW